jgi:hypothetical protein
MENTGTITWTVPGVPTPGNYLLRFGYLLPFGAKTQDMTINNGSVGQVVFDGTVGSWLQKNWTVPLQAGTNSIKIQKNWGYMNFDYIEVILPGPPAAPQIAILGGNLNIQNGDTSPAAGDGTSFGSLDIAAPAIVSTFIIENIGNAALSLTSASLGGPGSTAFGISSIPTQIPPGGTAQFTISFNPDQQQVYDATATILSNDASNSSFSFSITGLGTGLPVLTVQGYSTGGGLTPISRDSAASPSLGTVFSGTFPRGSTTHQFKLINTGSDSLILGTVQLNNPAFAVTAQPASIPAGGEGVLAITFTPPSQGDYAGSIYITGNGVAPYAFGIIGTGLARPNLSASFAFTQSGSSVNYPSLEGWIYEVQTSTDLLNWVTAPGTLPVSGTGSVVQITIPDAMSAPSRFYRLSEY